MQHQATHNRELSDKLLRWAHDIRSPLLGLNVISRNIEGLSPEMRALLDGSIERMRLMTDQVLAEAGLRTASSAAIEMHTDLAQLIDKIVATKWFEISNKPGITLETRFGRHARGLRARIAPLEFERILTNLIDNAVQAIHAHGDVRISLSSNPRERMALLLIEDTGRGFSPRVLEGLRGNVFPLTDRPDGIGLGLHYARQGVERAGGRFVIEAAPVRGAAIKLWLPLVGK